MIYDSDRDDPWRNAPDNSVDSLARVWQNAEAERRLCRPADEVEMRQSAAAQGYPLMPAEMNAGQWVLARLMQALGWRYRPDRVHHLVTLSYADGLPSLPPESEK